MKKLYLFSLIICLSLALVNAQQKKSLDEIDNESFKAGPAPFDKGCFSVNLVEKSIQHPKAPEDIILNGE
jgi:hypothetical protein